MKNILIIENYADLLKRIEVFEKHIDMLLDEVFQENKKAASEIHIENLHNKINDLNKRLGYYKEIEQELLHNIESLEGLPYKIAKMRFLEDKNYRVIAKELGYNYNYIRRVAAEAHSNEMKILKYGA